MNDKLGNILENIRIATVIPYVKGELLDIGCGMNNLKMRYPNRGLGVDIFDWGNVDIVVEDSSNLPFKDSSFDTITIIAALNHIPYRDAVVEECYRLLKPDGIVIITMIPPLISRVWHFLRKPWDVDQSERGMEEGEVYGLKTKEIIKIFNKDFSLVLKRRFMWYLNNLYIFKKV